MTEDHLGSLLLLADAKKDKDGWSTLPEGRHVTLYAAFNGASLSVSKIAAIKRSGELLQARTAKGETYVIATSDVYAGSVEAPTATARKAGFV